MAKDTANAIKQNKEQRKTMSLIKYTRTGENTVGVKNCGTEIGSCLEIPGKVENGGKEYIVTEICESCLSGNSTIEQIILPSSIVKIGKKAFAGCSQLSSISLPDDLQEIEDFAFAWSGIRSINIPEKAKVGLYAFDGCANLDTIYVQSSVPAEISEKVFDIETFSKATLVVKDKNAYAKADVWCKFANITDGTDSMSEIDKLKDEIDEEEDPEDEEQDNTFIVGNLAFEPTEDNKVKIVGCNDELEGELRLPSHINWDGKMYVVEELSKDALDGCDGLTKIVIPDTIPYVDFGTFVNCKNVESIEVSDNNTGMRSIDGVLVDKQKTILVAYPCGKKDEEYAVPMGINTLGHISFARNKYLKTLILPLTTTNIGIQTFYECEALETVSLPDYTERIGGGAFAGCNNLKQIYSMSVKPVLTTETFSQETMDSATLYVRDKAIRGYQQDKEWGKFKKIEACPNEIVREVMYTAISPYRASVNRCNPDVKGKKSIPEVVKIGGKDYVVTQIEFEAFSGNEGITQVVLPDSVNEIDYKAFEECKNMSSIKLPGNLEYIGNHVFSDCASLKKIALPGTLQFLGHHWVSDCSSLQEITIEPSLELETEEGVLYSKGKKQLITYPAGKKDYNYTIPKQVEEINEEAFFNCVNIGFIKVEEGNQSYISKDGILYDKEMKTLVIRPPKHIDRKYVMPDTVEQMKAWAMTSNGNLREVIFSDRVRSISFASMAKCENLETIKMPAMLQEIAEDAFLECASLHELEIPEGVTKISKYSFALCSGLEGVILPDTVEEIEEAAFVGCCNLSKVRLSRNLLKISKGAFKGCFVIGEEEKKDDNAYNDRALFVYANSPCEIEEDAFDRETYNDIALIFCSSEIDIRAYYEDVQWRRFDRSYLYSDKMILKEINSKGLKYKAVSYFELGLLEQSAEKTNEVVVPQSISRNSIYHEVTRLNSGCLEGCQSTKIRLPKTLTTIGARALRDCKNITSITLGSRVTHIYEQAFEGCEKLECVNLPNSLEHIGEQAFKNCKRLTSIFIPDRITEIKEETFKGCSMLKVVTIGEGVKSIAPNAFADCTSLETIMFAGDRIAHIASCAFKNCKSLKSIYLPTSVETVERLAFDGCENLEYLEAGHDTRLEHEATNGCKETLKIKKTFD